MYLESWDVDTDLNHFVLSSGQEISLQGAGTGGSHITSGTQQLCNLKHTTFEVTSPQVHNNYAT